jgi:hypothetical protein
VPEGAEKIPGIASTATLYYVRPDYFAVTGIPMKTGRVFGPQDGPADSPVAIIDEEAARRYWPGRSALGQRFRYSPYVPWITVIGVAGHVKTESFTNIDGDVQAYLPLSQVESAPYRSLLFRTEGNPSSVFASVRAHVRESDARVTVGRAGAIWDLYDRPLAAPRLYLLVMSMFGFLALATSGVGLYALLSYSVSQRTQEIGIRMALGADHRRVRSLVVRDALGSVVIGIISGTIGLYWLTRFLDWQLYHIAPHDPVTYAGVVLILLGVAALAAFLPARRATRVDPVEALRAE